MPNRTDPWASSQAIGYADAFGNLAGGPLGGTANRQPGEAFTVNGQHFINVGGVSPQHLRNQGTETYDPENGWVIPADQWAMQGDNWFDRYGVQILAALGGGLIASGAGLGVGALEGGATEGLTTGAFDASGVTPSLYGEGVQPFAGADPFATLPDFVSPATGELPPWAEPPNFTTPPVGGVPPPTEGPPQLSGGDYPAGTEMPNDYGTFQGNPTDFWGLGDTYYTPGLASGLSEQSWLDRLLNAAGPLAQALPAISSSLGQRTSSSSAGGGLGGGGSGGGSPAVPHAAAPRIEQNPYSTGKIPPVPSLMEYLRGGR